MRGLAAILITDDTLVDRTVHERLENPVALSPPAGPAPPAATVDERADRLVTVVAGN